MHMPQSDRYLEDIYDVVNRHASEPTRLEVARAAYLAAQHRAQQLAKKTTPAATPAEGIRRERSTAD